MSVYIIRTTTLDLPPDRVWWVFDVRRILKGLPDETLSAVLARWSRAHGPPSSVMRFRGLSRPSEAAATVASLRLADAASLSP